mgnify:CR=1 FL=1
MGVEAALLRPLLSSPVRRLLVLGCADEGDASETRRSGVTGATGTPDAVAAAAAMEASSAATAANLLARLLPLVAC